MVSSRLGEIPLGTTSLNICRQFRVWALLDRLCNLRTRCRTVVRANSVGSRVPMALTRRADSILTGAMIAVLVTVVRLRWFGLT